MSQDMDRTELVRAELKRRLDPLATQVVAVEAELFDTTADTLHAPFGYMPCSPEGVGLVFFYSPAIIAEQTEHLCEEHLLMYLHTLAIHISMHVTYLDEPLEEVERRIDRTIYDISPVAMRMANDVQVRARD